MCIYLDCICVYIQVRPLFYDCKCPCNRLHVAADDRNQRSDSTQKTRGDVATTHIAPSELLRLEVFVVRLVFPWLGRLLCFSDRI